MAFTHMETADQRTTEHKRFLIKTTYSSPVKLQSLRVRVIVKALVHLPLIHTQTRTHSPHGLTPTLQVASITTLLKPAATPAACTTLKPTIGLRNSWFSLFSFWSPLPCIVFNQAISPSSAHPQYASTVRASKVGDCWSKSVIFKLTGKHLAWTETNLFLILTLHTTFSSLCRPSSFSEAFAHGDRLPICAGPVASVERSVQVEHEQLQKFLVKWMEVTVTAKSTPGMAAPSAPHSGQQQSKSLLSPN